MKILVINAGSSSLKYQLMDSTSHDVLAKGLCERIGIDGRLTHKVPGKEDYKVDIAMPTHGDRCGGPPGPPWRHGLYRKLHHR